MSNEITIKIDLDELVVGDNDHFDENGEPTRFSSFLHLVLERTVEQVMAAAKEVIAVTVREVTQAAVGEEIQKVTREVIADEVLKPYQPTNSYGEPHGEPVALRERLVKEVNSAMTAVVDYRGQKTSRFSTDGKMTYVQYLLQEQVDKAFRVELANVISAEKDKVREAIRDQAADILAETIERIGQTK